MGPFVSRVVVMYVVAISVFDHIYISGLGPEVPISVVSGAYWKQIPGAVLYESSIPLLYKTTWPGLDPVQLSKESNESGFCNVQSDPQCILFKWIKYVDKVIGERVKMINATLGDNMSYEYRKQRVKRSLRFIGDFMNYCCGVATTRELRPLFTNENNLKNVELQLQEQLKEAYAEIGDITLSLNNYGHQIEATLAQVIDVGVNLTRVIDRLQVQEIARAQEVDKKIFSLLQVITHMVARQVQTLQLIARLEISSQCREKKIPTTLIQPYLLKHDLSILAVRIREDQYELVISEEEVSTYFKLEIADCVISENTILITVKIPIRKMNSDWRLYEMIGTPFAWNNNTCVLQHDHSYLAVNRDVMMPIKDRALHDCQPYSNPLCYVPRYLSDAVSSSACTRQLFTGATIQELTSVCIFSCVPGNTPTVSRVDDVTYVVTHGSGPLQLTCRYHTNHTFRMPHEGMPGALEIKVPCDCQLKVDNQILVSGNYPCNNNATYVLGLVHMIPAVWSKLKSLKINSLQTHVSSTFNTFHECLDHDWPTKIPHLNVSFSDRLPIHNTVLTTMMEHTSYLSKSTILLGIYVILLTIIVLRNPYLLGIQLVRPVHAQSEVDNSLTVHSNILMLTWMCIVLLYVIWMSVKCWIRRNRRKAEITNTQGPPFDLPNDLVVAKVDGRELHISLEWTEG